jgi:hypothetical protein
MRLLILTVVLIAAPLAGAQSHSHHGRAAVSAAALAQIREVQRALQPITTPEAARTAGFEAALGWIPMMGTHFVHGQRMLDGKSANSSRTAPSQLMFSPVGGKETLVGAAFAYYAPVNAASPPPVLFDGAPAWHDHPDLAPPGTNMLMLHVWFVPSPDGPFAGLNPFLPFWAAGVTPPDASRLTDSATSVAVRTAAVALAEIVDPAGLFPVLARRPAVKIVLDERRAAIRAMVPQLEAAHRAKDAPRWDGLIADVGRHFAAMREAYLTSALDPQVKARIAKALDGMIRGSH